MCFNICRLDQIFYILDHKILLSTLYLVKLITIKNSAFSLIKSYLSNRMQFIYINGALNLGKCILCEVPQDVILSPTF